MNRKRFLNKIIFFIIVALTFKASIVNAQHLQKSLNGRFRSSNILSNTLSDDSNGKKGISYRPQDTLFEEIARDRPDNVVIEEFSDALVDSSMGQSSMHYDEDARKRKASRAIKRITGREIDNTLKNGQLASLYKSAKRTTSKINNLVVVKKEHSSTGFEYIPKITAGIDIPGGFNPSMRIGKNARMYYDWTDQTTRFEVSTRW